MVLPEPDPIAEEVGHHCHPARHTDVGVVGPERVGGVLEAGRLVLVPGRQLEELVGRREDVALEEDLVEKDDQQQDQRRDRVGYQRNQPAAAEAVAKLDQAVSHPPRAFQVGY